MPSTISATSRVMVAKEQVSCDLAGEAAILNLQTGVYYGLDHVGARIWNLIQQPMTVSDVLQVLLKEYEVNSERCENDVFGLLQELASEGLIEVT